MDIILIGRIGETTAMKVAREKLDRLKERYPLRFLKDGIASLQESFTDDDGLSLVTERSEYIYPIEGESISDALWKLGEALDSGLRVELDRIRISSFCIELAEFVDESPYKWDSTGCVLCLGNEADLLVTTLSDMGTQASVIGHLTSDHARRIYNHGTGSFLTPPEN